jgi:hypothetical protein
VFSFDVNNRDPNTEIGLTIYLDASPIGIFYGTGSPLETWQTNSLTLEEAWDNFGPGGSIPAFSTVGIEFSQTWGRAYIDNVSLALPGQETGSAPALNKKPLSDYDKTNSGFVTLLYNRILDRDPDATGLVNQVAALDAGLSRMDLVYNFIFSEECQNTISGYSNEQFIKFLYQAIFNREPESAGLNDWLSHMSAGMTKADVVNAFTHSLEFEFLY